MKLLKGSIVARWGHYESYEVRNYISDSDVVILKTVGRNDYISATTDDIRMLRPLSGCIGVYDEVILLDNNIVVKFIVTDTYGVTGTIEIERFGYTGDVLYVTEDQIKKIN